mmetsp:Transcript_2966/g.6028  ORF Transcript_2966/g.6028 Transcript_2966/m.6028 type:complete len:93 (+) Transcript_2966:530-808(+)
MEPGAVSLEQSQPWPKLRCHESTNFAFEHANLTGRLDTLSMNDSIPSQADVDREYYNSRVALYASLSCPLIRVRHRQRIPEFISSGISKHNR